jgi:mRNA-degrading endonuclease RelE of RelBE toxin-antitoxin system
VISKRKRWVVSKIANSAKSNINNLEFEFKEQVIKRFERLQADPFEGDIKKAKGKKNIYRGRIGDYRYYFRIFSESKSIEILGFDHRSNIKKKTIQRFR